MATHDPREAVYLGGRVIVLGRPGEGIVFDRVVDCNGGKRTYASGTELEREIIDSLFNLESVVVP
jgi:ABC-type nitrate/sulfonate/bicarbonate transport system ATPase subunit